MTFQAVCTIEDIIPGTGVCALVDGEQIAIFRPTETDEVYAISNEDPFFNANVLSRGLIVEHKGELWVASPLKKQRFHLASGTCLEDSSLRVKSYRVRVVNGTIEVAV